MVSSAPPPSTLEWKRTRPPTKLATQACRLRNASTSPSTPSLPSLAFPSGTSWRTAPSAASSTTTLISFREPPPRPASLCPAPLPSPLQFLRTHPGRTAAGASPAPPAPCPKPGTTMLWPRPDLSAPLSPTPPSAPCSPPTFTTASGATISIVSKPASLSTHSGGTTTTGTRPPSGCCNRRLPSVPSPAPKAASTPWSATPPPPSASTNLQSTTRNSLILRSPSPPSAAKRPGRTLRLRPASRPDPKSTPQCPPSAFPSGTTEW